MKVAIIGAGAFGTALGGVLADNGIDVDYYDSKLEKERLSDVVADAKYVVLCVPSKVIPHLLPHLPKDKPLIVATKGILRCDVFDAFKDWMVLSGPGFAKDIKDRQLTTLSATDKRVIDLFKNHYIDFDYTEDKCGVMMCGALKNIYAILAGYLHLEYDSGEWHSYLGAALNEIKAILKLNGARAETAELVCGIGDLKITCYYPSRNYEFGRLISDDPEYVPTNTVEGLSALKRVINREIKVPDDAELMHRLIEMGRQWV